MEDTSICANEAHHKHPKEKLLQGWHGDAHSQSQKAEQVLGGTAQDVCDFDGNDDNFDLSKEDEKTPVLIDMSQ